MGWLVKFSFVILTLNIWSVSNENNDGMLESLWIEKEKVAVENYKSKCDANDDIIERQWINNRNYSQCACYLPQITKDLAFFTNGISNELLRTSFLKGVTYAIYKGDLYRSPSCSFPARCQGVEHFLLQIIPSLPDMVFTLNPRDWPQVPLVLSQPQYSPPIFSFSKTPAYVDIHYPAWAFWAGGPAIKLYPTGLGRWDLHRKTLLEESQRWPWDRKFKKGFFRGSRTNSDRDVVVLLSRAKPELLDASYTKNQAWKSNYDTLNAPPAEEVSLEYHCRFKYLINFAGVAASFRFKHLFLCGSLVVHADVDTYGEPTWSEFFYSQMHPWVHYVPLPKKEQQIERLILFLQQHDTLAERIAKRGQQFIERHLRLEHVLCYWHALLTSYHKLLPDTKNIILELLPKLVQIKS